MALSKQSPTEPTHDRTPPPSPDGPLREVPIATQRVETERCEALHIGFCVIPPGAHLGRARPAGERHDLDLVPTRDERAGLARLLFSSGVAVVLFVFSFLPAAEAGGGRYEQP